MNAPTLPPDPPSHLLQRFDDAQQLVAGLLVEALATSSPGAFIDALGLDALEQHLPAPVRLRLMQRALHDGRAGKPFDDASLLGIVSPGLLAAHVPASVLRQALARLAAPASLAPLPPEVAVPPEAATPASPRVGDVDPEPLDDDDEMTVALDDESTRALLEGIPLEGGSNDT